MTINTNTWNKIRYTIYQPFYDIVADTHRKHRVQSINKLALKPNDQVLIVGAGTGLDLLYLKSQKHITAIDITPSMVADVMQRSEELSIPVDARVMDGQHLAFGDNCFDAVILHFILAVIPDPVQCLKEVFRVLRPNGRVVIMDTFLPSDGKLSLFRKALSPVANLLYSDITRHVNDLLDMTSFNIKEDDEFDNSLRIVLATPQKGEAKADSFKAETTSIPPANIIEEIVTNKDKYSTLKKTMYKPPIAPTITCSNRINLAVFETFPIVETERCRLRAFHINDASPFYQLQATPKTMAYMDRPLIKSPIESMAIIRKLQKKYKIKEEIAWVIETKDTKEFMGFFTLKEISINHASARLAYMLLEKYWGKGFMSEIMAAALRFGKEEMGLYRFEAEINSGNLGSRKLLAKFGFQKEAHFRENYYFDGVFKDSEVFGLLSKELHI